MDNRWPVSGFLLWLIGMALIGLTILVWISPLFWIDYTSEPLELFKMLLLAVFATAVIGALLGYWSIWPRRISKGFSGLLARLESVMSKSKFVGFLVLIFILLAPLLVTLLFVYLLTGQLPHQLNWVQWIITGLIYFILSASLFGGRRSF